MLFGEQTEQQKEYKPERDLNSFCSNEFLSDCVLVSKEKTELELPFHKVILASASDFIYHLFKEDYKQEIKNSKVIVNCPKKIDFYLQRGDAKEALDLIFRYCYNNQNFKSIQNEVTENNVYDVLSYAHCLKIESLLKYIEDKISNEYINDGNVLKINEASVLFNMDNLKKKCSHLISSRFASILKRGSRKDLINLTFDSFKQVISDDNIEVENEKEICDLVSEYIKSRREIKRLEEEQKKKPQEKPQDEHKEEKKEGQSEDGEEKKEEEKKEEEKKEEEKKEEEKKDEEEKKEEEKKEEEKKEEEKKEEEKKDEEDKKEEGEEEKKEEEGKKEEDQKSPEESHVEDEGKPIQAGTKGSAQVVYDDWNNYINDVKKSIERRALTPEQERELVLCIRFSFLSHNDLLAYKTDPIIGEHKDLLMEGLSFRLNPYEQTTETQLQINTKPRASFQDEEAYNSIQPEPQQQFMKDPSMRMYNSVAPQQPPYKGSHLQSSIQGPNLTRFDQTNSMRIIAPPQELPKSVRIPNRQIQQSYLEDPYSRGKPISLRTHMVNSNLKSNFNQSQRFVNTPQTPFMSQVQNRYGDENDSFGVFGQDTINMDDYPSSNQKMFAKSVLNPIPPQDPKILVDFFKNQSAVLRPELNFKYEYDFDENGVFYYLGTMGKMYPYKNPMEIGQVKVFCSSLGKGSLSDFVGRNLVNLRTQNEEKSFFGVDLGQERALIPTAYSIKNRNSSAHVMLCWTLEGSNDKVNYEVLDTRIFSNGNNSQVKFRQNLEKERNMLKKPGCTSTWGINKKVKERFPGGFRYFILKQIDKNSSGGYNLAISGFELYGEPKGRNWNFN